MWVNLMNCNKVRASILAIFMSGLLPSTLYSAPLNLPNVPIDSLVAAEPNVVLTLDNSGSMNWTITPDALRKNLPANSSFPDANSTSWSNVLDFASSNSVVQGRSASQNITYYDPTIEYTPWRNSTDTGIWAANVPTNCAPYSPLNFTGSCLDFTMQKTANLNSGSKTFWPATYYNYNSGAVNNAGSYTMVEVKPTVTTYDVPGGAIRPDCTLDAGTGVGSRCTYAEELQNFANWFTYYRARLLMAKAGVGMAFSKQGADMRVGYATLNNAPSSVDGKTNGSMVLGVRHFDGTDRDNFFDTMYKQTAKDTTPLRKTLENVGEYYTWSGDKGPWGNKPGVGDGTLAKDQIACRQNYHILTTDGYWRIEKTNKPTSHGNVDDSVLTLHTSATYGDFQYGKPATIPPYRDDGSNTLADMAMYYWDLDLRTDLEDIVPPNASDPAYWQHMVNYTVGLGITGTLINPDDWPALQLGAAAGGKDWPAATENSPSAVDDLWHAAVNSRGLNFSAKNPIDFATALGDAMADISGRGGAVANLAVSTNAPGSSRTVFTVNYTGDWTGDLVAYPVDIYAAANDPYSSGVGSSLWHARDKVSAQNYNSGRKIVTMNPTTGKGVQFRWATGGGITSAITAQQKNDLNINPKTAKNDGRGSERLDFIRGREGITGFRNRNGIVLGDIVDSSPAYVGKPAETYPEVWQGGSETSFKAFKSMVNARPEMVYVGANDGMLHGFNVKDGTERFAYVPNAVFSNLNELTSTSYKPNHHFYVDGALKAQSAFFRTSGVWKTVLAGALRSGGKAIFALDVTAPENILTEADATQTVLWEFTGGGSPNLMGYVYGDIAVVRMANGDWAAVFGNGYNSNDEHAALFIVNIEDGSVIKTIDMGRGLTSMSNGLATPNTVDVDGDKIIDYIYAGDLQGNLWKVDVRDSNPANWSLANGSTPLFTAKDSTGTRQSIMIRPSVGLHPESGYFVFFGTGKYLEVSDVTRVGQQTQSVYGIWDKDVLPFTAFGRGNLLQQKIYNQVALPSSSAIEARFFTNDPIDWTVHMGWYFDLITTGITPLDNLGERIIHNFDLRSGRLIFTSFLPRTDPCTEGLDEAWIFQVDAKTGGRLDYSVWDINDDLTIADPNSTGPDYDLVDDGSGNSTVVTGVRVGKSQEARMVKEGGDCEILTDNPATGQVVATKVPCPESMQGRQSWIRIQ